MNNDGTQGLNKNPDYGIITESEAPGLSPAAVKLAYRLMGLEDRVRYTIVLVKMGDTWVYDIEQQQAKVECAQ